MKLSTMWLAVGALAFVTPALAQPSEKIISRQAASSDVELRDVQIATDGSVKGSVVNNTKGVLKDVKLLVMHTWYWKDERHPGTDNPGRSDYISVPGQIAAGASTTFSYTPNPPLAKRTDGTFQTTVGVQSFEQVGG